jgi:hypothetical protein
MIIVIFMNKEYVQNGHCVKINMSKMDIFNKHFFSHIG